MSRSVSGNGLDRMVGSHLHDGDSVFSGGVAIAMNHGNTIPDGSSAEPVNLIWTRR